MRKVSAKHFYGRSLCNYHSKNLETHQVNSKAFFINELPKRKTFWQFLLEVTVFKEEPQRLLGVIIALGGPYFVFIFMKLRNLTSWPWSIMNYYTDLILPYLVFFLKLATVIAIFFYLKMKVKELINFIKKGIIKILLKYNNELEESIIRRLDIRCDKQKQILDRMEYKTREDIKSLSQAPLKQSEISTESVIKNFV